MNNIVKTIRILGFLSLIGLTIFSFRGLELVLSGSRQDELIMNHEGKISMQKQSDVVVTS